MICEAPGCAVDLEPMKAEGRLRAHATTCSAACRAAKSRAKQSDPDELAAERFRRALHSKDVRPAIETPTRRKARERRNRADGRIVAGQG